MAKKKTSAMREKSSKPIPKIRLKTRQGLKKSNPLEFLTNPKNIGLAILECLENNDPKGVMDVIEIYVKACSKIRLQEEGNIPKSTFYHFLKHKNPTVKTLAKVVSAAHAQV